MTRTQANIRQKVKPNGSVPNADLKVQNGDKEYAELVYDFDTVDDNWRLRVEEEEVVEEVPEESKLIFTCEKRIYPNYGEYANYPSTTDIIIHSSCLIAVLRHETPELDTLFDDVAKSSAQELHMRCPDLTRALASRREKETSTTDEELDEDVKQEIHHLSTLIHYVSSLYKSTTSKLERLRLEDSITFDLLWAIFPRDTIVGTHDPKSGLLQAFKVTATSTSNNGQTRYTTVTGKSLIWNGTNYAENNTSGVIYEFRGSKKRTGLKVFSLSDAQKSILTERGRFYNDLPVVAFSQYTGNMFVTDPATHQIIEARADGRVVIDIASYARMNPNLRVHHNHLPKAINYLDDDGVLREDAFFLLPPLVQGFSLARRGWGEFDVLKLSEIEFNEKAWDSLSIDSEYKDVIKSLVHQNSGWKVQAKNKESTPVKENKTVTDVIDGKEGGLVIALHGKPGVGKTLTAESVAETLRVPLYCVGASDLSIDAGRLETVLRNHLDTAKAWGAVLLIDEADVFLEKRSTADVHRNGLVSVFLKLLEYHSGILILTTNLVESLDPAFTSRFSLMLMYPDLDAAKRAAIWRTFLGRAGAVLEGEKATISQGYLEELAAMEKLNGRNVKNIVRTAQSFALSKDEILGDAHIQLVLRMTAHAYQ